MTPNFELISHHLEKLFSLWTNYRKYLRKFQFKSIQWSRC